MAPEEQTPATSILISRSIRAEVITRPGEYPSPQCSANRKVKGYESILMRKELWTDLDALLVGRYRSYALSGTKYRR